MNYLFVIPRMGGGGAERVMSRLCNALAEKGNAVTLLTLVGGESFYPLDSRIRYESVGVTVCRKNGLSALWSKLRFLPKAFFALRKKIKQEHYDGVFSMLPECDILVGLCKLTGLRFCHICSERNDPNRRSRMQLAILKKVYKRASLFVCQSKRVYDFYDKVPENRKCVISNPVDRKKLPARLPETKRIVAVGRLDSQKNFPLLIDSFAALDKQFGDFKLDIYGEGPERAALERQIEELGMEKRITLQGAKQNLQSLMADSALFVMSSDYEGFPNALLEAMAIGLPVISTDFATGTARELIGEENGILVPVGDGKALTAAMETLLSDAKKRRTMGENNRILCQKYDIPQIIAQWEAAIERAVKERPVL